MTLPRLTGPSVVLQPASLAIVGAVGAGLDVGAAARAEGLQPGRGWPHGDTAAGLRLGAGAYLILHEDVVVGECGLAGPPGPDGGWEISYGLAAPARGRGIGTEAVAVLAAWAEVQSGVTGLTADVLVGNLPSRRLLERLGFTQIAHHPPYVHYRRERPGQARRIAGRHVC